MLGERLNLARKDRGFTAQQMAEAIDTGLRNYRKYESGDARPSIDALVVLADKLGVTTDFLLGRD